MNFVLLAGYALAGLAVTLVFAPLVIGRSMAWTHGLHAGYFFVAAAASVPLVLLVGRPSPPNPHEEHGRGIPVGVRTFAAITTLWFMANVGVEASFAGWIYKYAQLRHLAHGNDATLFGAAFLLMFYFLPPTASALFPPHEGREEEGRPPLPQPPWA